MHPPLYSLLIELPQDKIDIIYHSLSYIYQISHKQIPKVNLLTIIKL